MKKLIVVALALAAVVSTKPAKANCNFGCALGFGIVGGMVAHSMRPPPRYYLPPRTIIVETPMCKTWVDGRYIGERPCQQHYLAPSRTYYGGGQVAHPFITNSNGQR